MKKSLHKARSFLALFLALTLALPMVSLASYYNPESDIQPVIEDCVSLGYAVDALPAEAVSLQAFGAYEETSASSLVGTVVRTWGSQFALSSAAEWAAARNPVGSSPHVVPANIIIDNTIGFEADPTALAAYRRDERGALMLATGVLTATYESVPFAVNNFTHLINSFGADTPEGTWIEVWVRVGRSADDLATIAWLPIGNPTPAAGMVATLRSNPHSAANFDDGFLTSGRWSPFSQDFNQGIRRTFSTSFVSGGAQQMTGTLAVSGAPANVVQYRITLHRDCDTITSPVVRNVHGSTRNIQIDQTSQPKAFPPHEFPARNFNGQAFPGGNTDRFPTLDSIFAYLAARPIDMDRQSWNRGAGDSSVVISPGAGHGIYMQGFPMRSQQATGPILGGVNCSAVTIGMIINGFLDMEDITPLRTMEEVGLNLFDYQMNGFGNWQFTVAGAGTYGLRAHVEYNDRNHDNDIMMETILRHLLSGHALGLSLQFSSDPSAPHFIPRTDGTTGGHLIVLLGVVQRSGNWYVISYEPWSGTGSNANDRVYREFPMQNLVNAMRFTGANNTHNIIYVVKPGVEPGAGTAAPIHLESYLVQIAPGEFALSTDGTNAGIIPIRGMDRGQIGGPSGFVGYTVDPNFSHMGTTTINPHGQAGTKFRYLPLGDTIRFGYDAHTPPPQPFTYAELTNPNFRLYVWMGNGFTHVVDASRVPAQADLYPELRSPGNEFRVNNPLRIVAPYNVPLALGETTIGTLRAGLQATLGGTFGIFAEGTVINSVADFLAAPQRPDSATLAAGDFIVAVNASQTLFATFSIDHFGLMFERSGVGETIRLEFYDVTRAGSPNFYAWSNPLTGWEAPGRRVVYTATMVVGNETFPTTLVDDKVHDTGIRGFGTTGFARIPVRFVEDNPAYPGGFRLIPYSTTGDLMPWRQGLGQQGIVRITATVESTIPNDPFDGEYRSFYVNVAGGGPATGGVMRVGYYTTGHLTPSFTWGTFRAPAFGERAYNLTFSHTEVLNWPVINVPGRPVSPVAFPYVPYANDRPYWMWNTTWDGSVYVNADTHTRVNWFRVTPEGTRTPVPLDENHGYTFGAGNVYEVDFFLCTAMHPPFGTWNNLPAAGAQFNTFVNNIAGLPRAGHDGVRNVTVFRSNNWNLGITLTFDPLTAPAPDFGLQIFNNGPGGTPSIPNDSMAQAGIIRMWTQLDGVGATVPYADLTVTAELADGTNAMQFVRVNNMWDNPGNVNLIDVNKHAPWQTIYLTAALGAQTVEVTLVNSRFLSLVAFNNGTDAQVPGMAGTIRIWPELGGTGAPIPMSAVITAVDQDGADAMQFVTPNRQWTDAGWRDYIVNIDVDKNAPWQTITFTVTVYGQTVTLELINNRFLSLVAFNNGTDAEVPSMAGNIRIWPQLGGTGAPIPMSAVVTAVDQSGANAMQFVTVNRVWCDTAGWLNYIGNFDVTKDAPWETITFTVTVFGQTVELLLINDWFGVTPSPILSFDIFNNGPGGTPSTPNASLAAAGIIRMWVQLDGAGATVPYANLTVTATDQNGANAMGFVRVNNMWDNPGNVNLIDVDRNGAWDSINMTVTFSGQTVNLLLMNP